MKDTAIEKKRRGLDRVVKVLLTVLVLVGLGAAGHAATSEEDIELLQSDQLYVFDPFLLTSVPVANSANSDPGMVNSNDFVTLAAVPPIYIPSRPALRSPFRPPLS